MLPNVYATLRLNSAVVTTVANRIYRHGSAPQNVVKPYVTWFTVSGMPENNLSDSPFSDMDSIQIDCWHETDTGVEQLALAVRNALDNAKIVNRLIFNGRENETRLYRIGLEADFITSR